jgi:hypothetical protein
MSEYPGPKSLWTLQCIQEWARATFRADFDALPDPTTLTFENFDQEAWSNEVRVVNVNTVALLVGVSNSASTEGRNIYAVVHGSDYNQIS